MFHKSQSNTCFNRIHSAKPDLPMQINPMSAELKIRAILEDNYIASCP